MVFINPPDKSGRGLLGGCIGGKPIDGGGVGGNNERKSNGPTDLPRSNGIGPPGKPTSFSLIDPSPPYDGPEPVRGAPPIFPEPIPTGGMFGGGMFGGGMFGGSIGGSPGDDGITLSPIGNCGEKLIPGCTTCENGIPPAID